MLFSTAYLFITFIENVHCCDMCCYLNEVTHGCYTRIRPILSLCVYVYHQLLCLETYGWPTGSGFRSFRAALTPSSFRMFCLLLYLSYGLYTVLMYLALHCKSTVILFVSIFSFSLCIEHVLKSVMITDFN